MILVTGGTGFVGQTLVRQLVSIGLPVRTLLRPSSASPNLPKGIPVDVAVCSLKDERGLRAALKGVDIIYHLAGSERMGSRSDLTGTDVEGSQSIAAAAAEAGVRRIIFLSHLGADRFSAYPLLKAKALAESSLIHSGIAYTIFRSAVLYGPDDQFTTSLVRLIKRTPGVFLMPNDGGSLLQPLWIDDLVTCLAMAMDDPQTENQTYEIGGTETFSFRQIVEIIMRVARVRRKIISLNPAVLQALGLMAEESTSNFPLSLFWLDYLAVDRTCALDSLPRLFGLMPARFTQSLDYLIPESRTYR